MSFGFSVGDLIGAANLTYKLIAALRENHDAGEEYRAAIDELGCYQTALMKVSCLARNTSVSRDTFDAASHMVMQSMDMIQSYLNQTKKYDQRLGKAESSGFRYGVRKVRWTLLKADDMRKLRESLQRRNAGLQLLLQCAGLETDTATPQHISDVKQLETISLAPTNNTSPDDSISAALDDDTLQSLPVGQFESVPNSNLPEEISPALPDMTESPTSKLFSLSSFSADQLRSLISNQSNRESEIRILSTLLRTMVKLGDYQLSSDDSTRFLGLLNIICQDPKDLEAYKQNTSLEATIKFKDAVGRRFSFPWQLCKTWKGMEELIKQAFLHVDVIGPHVHEGHYDLVGPDGEIIMPQVWDTIIQPDWEITMHMWPMPEPPSPPYPHPPPPPPPPPPPQVEVRPSPVRRSKVKTSAGKAYARKGLNRDATTSPAKQPKSGGRARPSPGFLTWVAGGKEARTSESSQTGYSSSMTSVGGSPPLLPSIPGTARKGSDTPSLQSLDDHHSASASPQLDFQATYASASEVSDA